MSDTQLLALGPSGVETTADFGDGDQAIWQRWMAEDRVAGREEERWQRRGRRIIRRYRDEEQNQERRLHRFNILWSNVQVLLPTLYARTPKPDVQRRFLDPDDTGRFASLILERALTWSIEHCDFDNVMRACVLDRLLPGRGTFRVLYVPYYGDELPSATEYQDEDAATAVVGSPGDEPPREVAYEEVALNYVFWEDYREGPARTWREVPWIRYRAYMNRDELVRRFGRKKGERVNLDFHPPSTPQRDPTKPSVPPDIFSKAIVHEIWDRQGGEVIWLSPGTPDLILDRMPDPLGLADFFPSPDPLLATTTTDSRIPVPDYAEYQDQAAELDRLTQRIDRLTRALKVSGIYPGVLKQTLQQLVEDGTENRLIPVEDWAALVDKGGLSGAIQWMPLKEIAETLIQLYAARDKTKELLYEITGIGDIVRGETNPLETATAQRLKSNFVTRRIQPQQKDVARLARDAIRLMGEVIAGHFSARTVSMITGYPRLLPVPEIGPMPLPFLPAPMQQAPPANDEGPPPEALAQLREGAITRFGNGQRWTIANGQPRRVA